MNLTNTRVESPECQRCGSSNIVKEHEMASVKVEVFVETTFTGERKVIMGTDTVTDHGYLTGFFCGDCGYPLVNDDGSHVLTEEEFLLWTATVGIRK